MNTLIRITLATTAMVLSVSSSPVFAQTDGITRAVVTRADVSVPNREAVIARVDVAPGAVVGWHTHDGDEIGYAQEGEVELLLAGQPARTVKAGEGFIIPAGIVHSAKNHGTASFKMVGVYVVEKGKPLATPAAPPSN